MQRDDAAFGAAQDHARRVQRGGARVTARKKEVRLRRDPGGQPVDLVLERFDAGRRHERNLRLCLAVRVRRRRELRTEVEQRVLRVEANPVEVLVQPGGARDPDGGVGLVELPIGLDARVILRHAPPAKQPRQPLIPRPRINLHPHLLPQSPLPLELTRCGE